MIEVANRVLKSYALENTYVCKRCDLSTRSSVKKWCCFWCSCQDVSLVLRFRHRLNIMPPNMIILMLKRFWIIGEWWIIIQLVYSPKDLVRQMDWNLKVRIIQKYKIISFNYMILILYINCSGLIQIIDNFAIDFYCYYSDVFIIAFVYKILPILHIKRNMKWWIFPNKFQTIIDHSFICIFYIKLGQVCM